MPTRKGIQDASEISVRIEAVELGDETAGGHVLATLKFTAQESAPLFDIKGVFVTAGESNNAQRINHSKFPLKRNCIIT